MATPSTDRSDIKVTMCNGCPQVMKEQLVVTPAESLKGLPECNRRRRKIMEEEGFVLHLYAGGRDGHTLSRALQERGGDRRRLLEVDVLQQEEGQVMHAMLAEDGPYVGRDQSFAITHCRCLEKAQDRSEAGKSPGVWHETPRKNRTQSTRMTS